MPVHGGNLQAILQLREAHGWSRQGRARWVDEDGLVECRTIVRVGRGLLHLVEIEFRKLSHDIVDVLLHELDLLELMRLDESRGLIAHSGAGHSGARQSTGGEASAEHVARGKADNGLGFETLKVLGKRASN